MAQINQRTQSLLLDAVFINDGGGKILLDYLFEKLSSHTWLPITILLDYRLEKEYGQRHSDHIEVVFLRGLLARNKFYRTHGMQFLKVLCFANIPPNVRLQATVYTYFHQPMYLKIPDAFSIAQKLKFKLKILTLRLYTNNSDYWLVQSPYIKKQLASKFSLVPAKVIVLPFYPPFKKKNTYRREENSFIYISNANPHKNHKKLIDAFCQCFDRHKQGKLVLTVKDEFTDIFYYILKKISEGYPIENLGFIHREDLYQHYQASEYLIFPSLAESYGLGIIEAIENGCKVIGADLPYMHEICQPSLVFNPEDMESIYESFCKAITTQNLPESIAKTHNHINELLHLLTEKDENKK